MKNFLLFHTSFFVTRCLRVFMVLFAWFFFFVSASAAFLSASSFFCFALQLEAEICETWLLWHVDRGRDSLSTHLGTCWLSLLKTHDSGAIHLIISYECVFEDEKVYVWKLWSSYKFGIVKSNTNTTGASSIAGSTALSASSCFRFHPSPWPTLWRSSALGREGSMSTRSLAACHLYSVLLYLWMISNPTNCKQCLNLYRAFRFRHG